MEFFESKVRPVLVQKCYGCHNSKMKTPLGGLRLDTKDGLLRGGDSGAAVVPGDPERSRLIQAVTYRHELKMPPSGKLADEQIADLAAWIKMGAPDPRVDTAPAPTASQTAIDWTKAREFWAFQPVKRPAVPVASNPASVRSPVDAFILAKLEQSGLEPAVAADKAVLLRRVTFDLTGLPPTRAEIEAFLQDASPRAYENAVERLLASPHYGERWARHWLDLVRFAETNGHEYDNDKLDPWRYRDYVIRAFNEDVPYDQFVREHIAGDQLPAKRLRADGQAYESPIGTSFFWFGEVLNSATDSEKSRADDVDNQIDVASKAFLGMTVACARCHDHKFDPIPTADYYAMAGVFHSTDLREATVDSPERTAKITDLSRRIREVNRQIEAIDPVRTAPVATVSLRPQDKPFEHFDELAFGRWVPQGAAFGSGTVRGAADSRNAGSDVFFGTLTSPKFRTGTELFLHVRIGGTKSDPKLKERGPLRFTIVADGYKGQHIVPDGETKWKTLKLTFERERMCYFEIVDRSRDGHIFVDEIVFSTEAKPPEDVTDVAKEEAKTLSGLDEQRLKELHAERRRLEAEVPDSEFAMVAEDRDCRNSRLHIRGNHKNLGPEVPRRFLQVVAGEQQPPITAGSGRLHLADWFSSPENPLTARVMVNRIWKHHFAEGLVRSPDNFGKTGETPTHPELLDYLASEFVGSGWSVKAMHRLMVLSSTYRMSSAPSERAARVDPSNKLLQHMPVKRLEAEAIRDSILAVSGRLDPTLFGPSIVPFISPYQEGRGKPKSGPLDGDGRRSLYIQVRRNFMTPMFLAFDYPVPISSIGNRTVSTVPSQALLMMNNELVAQEAGRWADTTAREIDEPAQRIDRMYVEAFGRLPDEKERTSILEFAQTQKGRTETDVWSDIAHVLFNSPEFIYLQ
jgi:hypothetical protein